MNLGPVSILRHNANVCGLTTPRQRSANSLGVKKSEDVVNLWHLLYNNLLV